MAFDLEADEVSELREKYDGVNPGHEKMGRITSYVQEDLIDGKSALIGGLTTVRGIQSTKTRRPISASVDLIAKDADISALGEMYDSWSFQGAYFADIEDIEVGVLKIDEFEKYSFPDQALDNSYEEKIESYPVEVCEPESNIASKFNRIDPEQQVKESDAVDMNSHIHWLVSKNRGLERLSDRINDTVEPPYQERLEELKGTTDNFTIREKRMLEEANQTLESLLSETP